jgi:mRNA interferase MazF
MTHGDVCLVDFGIPFGSEPGYKRPVVIVQSDKENLNRLNTVVVVPLTSNTANADLPGNVFIAKKDSKLTKDSVALAHQIIVVDRFRLDEKLSRMPNHIMKEIENAIDYVIKE